MSLSPSYAMPFHTAPRPPIFHQSLLQVFAAASSAGFSKRLGWISRNGVEAPGELAVIDVVSREESADRVLAAADADDDSSAFDNAWCHRDRVGHVFGNVVLGQPTSTYCRL